MNQARLEAAARPRLATQFASERWSNSKLVVGRRSWSCAALSLAAIVAVVLSALPQPAAAQGCVGTLGPCFQALGFLAPPSSSLSFVNAISPDGSVVVGGSINSAGFNEAFSWTAGTMSGLGFPGCTGNCISHASGVNQQGVVAGDVGNEPLVPDQPYSWINGVATPLALLPGLFGALVFAVAAQEDVVVGTGESSNAGNSAIVWRNGVATALPPLSPSIPSSSAGGVSGNGQVIVGGTWNNESNEMAVMWQGTTVTPLAFLQSVDTYAFAQAANADGSVILGVSGSLVEHYLFAVRWVNGTPLGFSDFQPEGIDATGLVVSGAAPPNAVPGAERWTTADGERSIQSLLTAAGVDTTGWTFMNAYVNGNGRVFAGDGSDPNGRYQAFVARVPLPASLVTMHTHDFSGEGKSDLLWRSATGFGENTFPAAVWTMNGAQVVQSAAIGAVPPNWAIIGQRDFNGDGYADILWRDSSGNLSIWFMNGTQVSSVVGVGNVPNNWSVQGTGDLNGDGKGDLLWRDSATGTVVIWFMDGGNVLATANFGTVPSSWAIVADDNRGDVLWRDSSGNLAIWQINGTEIVQTAGLGSVPPGSGWSIAGIGDFNGDGFIDILWRQVTGAVSIWFSNVNAAQNNLPYIAYATSLGSAPTNFNIVQTGDYNGDGASDILWQDSRGNISIWFLTACGNVACVSSTAGVGNVAPRSWTLQALNVE
jgi:probable HAF family extracellular repeat protein